MISSKYKRLYSTIFGLFQPFHSICTNRKLALIPYSNNVFVHDKKNYFSNYTLEDFVCVLIYSTSPLRLRSPSSSIIIHFVLRVRAMAKKECTLRSNRFPIFLSSFHANKSIKYCLYISFYHSN